MLGMDVSYDKKKDEILITNPNTQVPPPEQPPKSPEPIMYKEELKLGDSVEFGNVN